MKLKNILLVVNDIERSKAFYKELFGLAVIRDFGENVILTEGLVLQERKVWEQVLEKEVQTEHHSCELYFEETDLDRFLKQIEESSWEIRFLYQNLEPNEERRFVRFYDLDGHVIEVGE